MNNPRNHLFLCRLTAGLLILLLAYGTGLYKRDTTGIPVEVVEIHNEEPRPSTTTPTFSAGETGTSRYQITAGGQP